MNRYRLEFTLYHGESRLRAEFLKVEGSAATVLEGLSRVARIIEAEEGKNGEADEDGNHHTD